MAALGQQIPCLADCPRPGRAGLLINWQSRAGTPLTPLPCLVCAGDKVEVAFDQPFSGGISLPGQRERCGWVCAASDLAAAAEDREDPWVNSLQALFDTIREEGEKGPLIVFVQVCGRVCLSGCLRIHLCATCSCMLGSAGQAAMV